MTKNVVDEDLVARLKEANQQAQQPLSKEEVAAIVHDIVTSMNGDISLTEIKLYKELESLANYIQAARQEIVQIRPDEIREDFIPSATDELDAIVDATEDATGRILDCAEQIMNFAGKLEDPDKSHLEGLSTEIFEASNFQDITGQRIGKVVKALKHIESKIDALVGVLGEEVQKARQQNEAVKEHDKVEQTKQTEQAVKDEDLLNGPQLPDEAIDQDEIDRLLAAFE